MWKLLGALAALGTLGAILALLGKGSAVDTEDTEDIAVPPGSDRFIERLHPSIQGRARDLLQQAANEGIALVITQGLRTNAEQQALYDQGRTKPPPPAPIVTNAPPGSSWHNFGLAFDVAEYTGTSKPGYPKDEAWWQRVGAIGKSLGLEWGGDSTTFPDRPHFEYHPDMTLADARAGRLPIA